MLFSLSKLLEDHLYHLVILLAHHHLNDNHCPQQYTSIVADMITYTISNIPCNLFVLICHLPFNLHCCLNDLQIRTPTAFPIHLPVYLTFHLHHLTVQHLLGYHWQCDYICRYASQCNELFSYTANMKTHMIVHSRGKAKQMQRKQKIILRSGHLKTHLLIYSEEKPHPCGQREESHREAESLKKHTYSITVERIHTVAQNAKRYSDRLEASVLICSFILERSCTHVDSVTNHSLKLKL